MVERSPLLSFFSHLIMVLGVIIVGFPLYLAFVASTHTPQDIIQVPMPLVPGSNFWETYKAALFGGSGPGSSAPVTDPATATRPSASTAMENPLALEAAPSSLVCIRLPAESYFISATSRWPMLDWPSAASSGICPIVLSATGSGSDVVSEPMPNALAVSRRASAPVSMPSSTNAVLHDRANASRSDAVAAPPHVLPL